MEKLVEHVLHLVSTIVVVPEHLTVYFSASNKLDLLYVPWSQHGHLPKLPDRLAHIVQPPLKPPLQRPLQPRLQPRTKQPIHPPLQPPPTPPIPPPTSIKIVLEFSVEIIKTVLEFPQLVPSKRPLIPL